MWQLHQFPLCPFSRKVRLVLGEKSVAYELVRQPPWEASDELIALNAAGRVPVLHDPARDLALSDSQAICEYLDETVERSPLLGGTAIYRAEIRRLIALMDENFFGDVVAPLFHEKVRKRLVLRQPPDGRVLREAMKLAHAHLDYIDWLVDTRSWIAGSTMSLADLAAAAQLSVADYLGGIDWSGHEQTRGWYAVVKSRPSFRPLLNEKMEGIHPPAHYALVDV
ncbi:glutathione S-transferase family protein [Qipengyuania sp. DY56-A-20]|jgi:glutathione S-transferase|uniref:Glutathione S-transferase family protein n=1 Tax=Qipengyuania benthica TaxID=3067651 RepID=A0ABT9H4X9_9SPHN|nr:glutathione S-transferase family protein [Qipengyuania sp. DY56-A-20]MBU1606544.1 glutathione S-transferase family protein [Alphaproteobacteria bacterium]MDP4538368.1 glutathione S-transferase family protein [Qipengyuania sp. DY56-A-20]